MTSGNSQTPLRSVLSEPFDPLRYPAQIASGPGTVWFVDTAAAQDAH